MHAKLWPHNGGIWQSQWVPFGKGNKYQRANKQSVASRTQVAFVVLVVAFVLVAIVVALSKAGHPLRLESNLLIATGYSSPPVFAIALDMFTI